MKSEKKSYPKKRITTALLLAAGTGSRLLPLTKKSPKCLTLVNETSILERLIKSLNQNGFKRLVVVTGHMEDCIQNFLETRAGNLAIEYVFSPLYKTTNNIYSLWMARDVINEPFLLIESDLVFDPSLLKEMLYPDRIAIAKMKPSMNGSTVTIDATNAINAFHSDGSDGSGPNRYKTVNIYSLSVSSWYLIIEKLNQFILAGKVSDYYETVFRQLVIEKKLSLEAVFFDHKPWYEIDTAEDLASAERLFPSKVRLPFNILGANFSKKTDLPVRKKVLIGSLYAQPSL
ncbi:MAG: phosphocholine cytidylyltransferase family protein [Deltaproteobacteria bacterium]|nr:phosphocholine cytidylyltransferase family protein [Deltaproteobacteria bacterium]